MAIGNPFGHGHSVAKGIVSAKERTLPGSYSQYLQVDAPINPGNSGGPLANMSGEVVGINNAVLMNAQGIGFAIPINVVKKILPQLKTTGHVDRGYLGINIEDLRPDLAKGFKADENLKAPFVTNVIKGGPGDKAGIKAYDIILEINGKRTKDTLELVNAITALPAGDKVQLTVQRHGKEKAISAVIGKRPSERPGVLSADPSKKSPRVRIHVDPTMQVETLDDEYRRELGLAGKVSGVVVLSVSFGGPADEAGLQRGDVILEVDRKPVTNVQGFFALVKEKKSYLLRVMRASEQPGDEEFLVVTLDLSEKPSKTED
jgi:serine protease Do